jgi:beta-barrel assembly-enhancing protease
MFKQISSFFWRSHRRWWYGVLSLTTALLITVSFPQPSYGNWLNILLHGVQVLQLSTISDQQEVDLGGQINQEIVKQLKIHNNRQINDYVNSIGQELAKNSTRPNIPYTFQVVNDNAINAFATMGGYVYIHTGLIKAADNEAELASVIGHEIGHVTARHSIKQMRQQAIAQGLLSAAGLDRSAAVQLGVDLALKRPHSRKDEFEADQLGVENMIKVGYDPTAAVTFMQKLQSMGGSIPTFLSTHPAAADRVVAIEKALGSQNINTGNGLETTSYRSMIAPLL